MDGRDLEDTKYLEIERNAKAIQEDDIEVSGHSKYVHICA